jgi:hypothetical protein
MAATFNEGCSEMDLDSSLGTKRQMKIARNDKVATLVLLSQAI